MRALDFFFALRPLVLVPAWSFFVLGHGLAGHDSFPTLRFALLGVVMAAVHLVNQVADAESDRINDKGFFLQRGIFPSRVYVAAASTSLVLALATAMGSNAAPGLLATAAALGLAYSLRPFRFAARPGLDVMANALGYGGLATWLGAGDLGTLEHGVARLGACMLSVAAVFLHTTLLDREGDRRTGKRTSGVVLGPQSTPVLASSFALAAMAVATVAAAPFLLGATIALAILTMASWLAPMYVTSAAVGVGGTALFAVAAGVYAPWFPVALALLVIATHIYYRRRFSLPYPSLGAARRRCPSEAAAGSAAPDASPESRGGES